MRKITLALTTVILTLAILSVCVSFCTVRLKKDCDDAKSSADNAYDYFKKAYNAASLDDVQYYAKKGMNSSSNAESEAGDAGCDCDNAVSAAEDAYSYGKKSYNADNLADAKDYAKKARASAGEISEEAEDCEK